MDDLSDALELTSDDFNEDEKILKGIVNFGSINVKAIMCPRIDVTAIDIKSGFDNIVPAIIKSNFSLDLYSDKVKGKTLMLYSFFATTLHSCDGSIPNTFLY